MGPTVVRNELTLHSSRKKLQEQGTAIIPSDRQGTPGPTSYPVSSHTVSSPRDVCVRTVSSQRALSVKSFLRRRDAGFVNISLGAYSEAAHFYYFHN